MLEVGSILFEVLFGYIKDGKMIDLCINEIFGDKCVVVFVVLGVFILICLQVYLFGYVVLVDKIKVKGVDIIVCLSVNDVYVMDVWGKVLNVEEIMMLVDGNGFFIKSIGMDMNISDFGGICFVCYFMLVEDGEVVKIFVEDLGCFEVSDVEIMLKNL